MPGSASRDSQTGLGPARVAVPCRLPFGAGRFAVELHRQLRVCVVEDEFTECFGPGLKQYAKRAGFRFDVTLAALTRPLAQNLECGGASSDRHDFDQVEETVEVIGVARVEPGRMCVGGGSDQ